MNRFLAKYLLYYPVTLAKGELVSAYMRGYRARQYWSPKLLASWQEASARRLFGYAAKHSPYYQDRLKDLDFSGEHFWESFKKIEMTEKRDVIESGDSMRTGYHFLSSTKTTGGSTGEPVKLHKNANALARERAATWRSYEWAGVSVGDPQGRFWGVPHDSLHSREASLIDFVANRKRVSAFDLTENALANYFKTLDKFRPVYLYGYVSVIETFANYVVANGLRPWRALKSIITTSEVLTDKARKTIEAAFGVKVFNEYGCGEVGSIAHECSHGSMHIVADNLIVETLNSEAMGELVVTDLFNYAQPLIRYRLGDFATLSDEVCGCGVTLPCVESIHGRAYDVIKTPEGKSVHPEALMYIFEGLQAKSFIFRKFQVVQVKIDQLDVFIVPSSNWSHELTQLICAEVHSNLSSKIQVNVQVVQDIPREQSGKMRVIKSLI